MSTETLQLVESLDEALASVVTTEALLAAAAEDGEAVAVGEALAAIGWPSVAIPEAHGGAGLDAPTRAELYALAGHHLLPTAHRVEVALLAPCLAALAHAGDPGAAEALADLEAGRVRGAGAVVPEALRDEREAGDVAVWGGRGGDLCIVVGSSRAVVVRLDGATVTPASAAAEPGQGLARVDVADLAHGWSVDDPVLLRALHAEWRLACVAECVGLAHRQLALTLRHASEREQFGRPLIRFQAVAHRIADMAARVELARSVLGRLALAPGAADGDVAAAAEATVPAAAREVCESAIQVHGGMGFSWESGLHLAYRRALSIGLEFGGPDAAFARVGVRLLDGVARRRASSGPGGAVDGGTVDVGRDADG